MPIQKRECPLAVDFVVAGEELDLGALGNP
jgi:hypothetical protein